MSRHYFRRSLCLSTIFDPNRPSLLCGESGVVTLKYITIKQKHHLKGDIGYRHFLVRKIQALLTFELCVHMNFFMCLLT